MRVFTAVEIESGEVLSKILKFKSKVASCSQGRGLKPVEDENIHITLRFIGEVPEDSIPAITACVERAESFSPFNIEVRGVGAFPTPSRPKVIWVGVSAGSERLKALRDEMEGCLRPLAKPDRKEFTPHITVARVKGRINLPCLKDLLESYADFIFGQSPVTEVKLKKSILRPQGPIYTDVLRVPLKGIKNEG
jgi:2'-5' RNA ligase